jgi:hypothetical protein
VFTRYGALERKHVRLKRAATKEDLKPRSWYQAARGSLDRKAAIRTPAVSFLAVQQVLA